MLQQAFCITSHVIVSILKASHSTKWMAEMERFAGEFRKSINFKITDDQV